MKGLGTMNGMNQKKWNKLKSAIKQYEAEVASGKVKEPKPVVIKPHPRCKGKEFIGDHICCGAPGHSGPHWRYNEAGWLIRWRDHKGLKPWDSAHSSCPPGHSNYISPEKMLKKYFRYVVTK